MVQFLCLIYFYGYLLESEWALLLMYWRGIPLTIEPSMKHPAGSKRGSRQTNDDVDHDLEALFQQHAQLAMNMEILRKRRGSPKTPLPEVPLPA